MTFWRRLWRRGAAPTHDSAPSVGADRRVYAIGDVHGRADLLDMLLVKIAQDEKARGRMPLTLILLGDLVDRGPSSRQVVERAIAMTGSGGDVRCLMGNHEEAFLRAAKGDERVVPLFRRMDGMATLASYGLDPALFKVMTDREIAEWMLRHLPRAHVDFLDALPDSVAIGDYLFVHAGIRPGVPVDRQTSADLRWIRGEFLEDERAHPKMVVHGHSITDDIDARANRIGIDTGAYYSGRLSAVGLESTDRWFLQTDG